MMRFLPHLNPLTLLLHDIGDIIIFRSLYSKRNPCSYNLLPDAVLARLFDFSIKHSTRRYNRKNGKIRIVIPFDGAKKGADRSAPFEKPRKGRFADFQKTFQRLAGYPKINASSAADCSSVQ